MENGPTPKKRKTLLFSFFSRSLYPPNPFSLFQFKLPLLRKMSSALSWLSWHRSENQKHHRSHWIDKKYSVCSSINNYFDVQWTIVWAKMWKVKTPVYKLIRNMNTIESEANIHIEQWIIIECNYYCMEIICFLFFLHNGLKSVISFHMFGMHLWIDCILNGCVKTKTKARKLKCHAMPCHDFQSISIGAWALFGINDAIQMTNNHQSHTVHRKQFNNSHICCL